MLLYYIVDSLDVYCIGNLKIIIFLSIQGFVIHMVCNFPGVSDRMRESLLRNTCEIALVATLHPRTSISVIIQEVQDSGGVSMLD